MNEAPVRLFPIVCVGLLAFCTTTTQASLKPAAPRTVIDLNGPWQVEQGDLAISPETYGHSVPVPGLVDMAQPGFADVGKKSAKRAAFWYRRTFLVGGKILDVAILKIHKAKYGSKVWVNGQLVGEHLPCFTPAYLDVKAALRGDGQENELVIRLGADRESMPQDMPTGWDFEKYLYIPGIYDSVELILTGKPYIRNVQVVPDIEAKQVRVVAEIECGGNSVDAVVTCKVTVAGTSEVAGEAKATISPSIDRAISVVVVASSRRGSLGSAAAGSHHYTRKRH